MTVEKHEVFSGPIPSPDILEHYEYVFPGAAERIFQMTERQMEHRIEIENKVIQSKIRDSMVGMVLGFLLALVISIIGGLLIWKGKEISGFTTIITAIAGLSGAFVYGTNSNRKEREEKNKSNNQD